MIEKQAPELKASEKPIIPGTNAKIDNSPVKSAALDLKAQPKSGQVAYKKALVNASLHDGSQLKKGKSGSMAKHEYDRLKKDGLAAKYFEE